MALINYHKSIVVILLLTIFICVSSKSIELDAQEMINLKYQLRARRQTTVPALLTDLGIFVGELLIFVSYLLITLGASLPIILGALGLGGLGFALDIIVTQLALIVLSLSRRKRQDTINLLSFGSVSYNDVVAEVINAQTAVTNINNLIITAQNLDVTSELNTIQTELNTINSLLTSGTASATDIQSQFDQIIDNLIDVVVQVQSTIITLTNSVQSNTITLLQGATAPLNYIAGLGTSLTTVVTGTGLSATTLVLQNVAVAQNATIINLSNLDNAFFAIFNSTVTLLSSTTTQLGNTASQAIISCTSTTR